MKGLLMRLHSAKYQNFMYVGLKDIALAKVFIQ
jgi:hypothetical protein